MRITPKEAYLASTHLGSTHQPEKLSPNRIGQSKRRSLEDRLGTQDSALLEFSSEDHRERLIGLKGLSGAEACAGFNGLSGAY